MMWGYGGFGFMWMALFWFGVIMLVVWAVRRNDESRSNSPDRAIEILAERFARGEIDTDEFETRRQQLGR